MALDIEHISCPELYYPIPTNQVLSDSQRLIGDDEEQVREPQILSINLLPPVQLFPPLDPSIPQIDGPPEKPLEVNLSNDQENNRRTSRINEAKTSPLGPDSNSGAGDLPTSDSDDVEFLVSIPRRRKKKRKSHRSHVEDEQRHSAEFAVQADHTPSKHKAGHDTTDPDCHPLSNKFGQKYSPNRLRSSDSPQGSPPARTLLHLTSGVKNALSPSMISSQTLHESPLTSKSPTFMPSTKNLNPRKRKHVDENSSAAHPSSVVAQNTSGSGLQNAVVLPMQQNQPWHPAQRLVIVDNTSTWHPAQHLVIADNTSTLQPSSLDQSYNNPLISTSPAEHDTSTTAARPRVTSGLALPAPSYGISLTPSKARVISTYSVRTPSDSDLRRKPSLYRVPQWTSSLPESSPVRSHTPNGNRPRPADSGRRQNFPQIQKTPIKPTLPQTVSSSPSTSQKQSQPSTDMDPSELENPSPKHAQNLLVDIAQTCQATFPFALIAERHNQPIQKVFDIFSAVIQVPLLRTAADKRRLGQLGKDRVNEFRAAKKDVLEQHKQERRDAKKIAKAQKGQDARTGPLVDGHG